MVKEVALSIFGEMPHFALNILDLAKEAGANLMENIGSALLNTVVQIIFFIVNPFVLPWLVHKVIEKNGDNNGLYKKLDKALEDRDERTARDLLSILELKTKIFMEPAIVINSWTSDFLVGLINIPILLLSFNHPRRFECYVDRTSDKWKTKGKLNFGYRLLDSSKAYWKNPLKQFGKYLSWIVYMIVPLAFPIAILYWLLPDTFSSVASVMGQWTAFQSGVPNIEFFTNMISLFKDIIWDRMILVGINENIVFFVIYIVVWILYSDKSLRVIEKVHVTDDNGEPTGELKIEIVDTVYSWPMTAMMICLFNLVMALFNRGVYSAVSYSVNSIGMIVLLLIIMKEIVCILNLCFVNISKFAFKLKG